MKCTRCGQPNRTLPIYKAQAHTWFLPSQSDFKAATPPSTERVCGTCITDDEIVLELSSVVDFVLGVHVKRGAPEHPEFMKALETVRALFMVRNNNPDGINRGAALQAVGLADRRNKQ